LRATANAACLQDEHWAELMAYEEKVQATLRHHKVITLCSYPLNKLTASKFLQAVNCHDCTLVRRQGGWECIESTGGKQLLNRLFVKEYAIASSNSPMVMTDLAGNLTYANPAALKAWGYDNESEVLNRPMVDFWESPQELIAYMENVRASGSGVGELPAKREDGSTFDVEVLGSLTRDDRGQPIGMAAMCLDLTARKAAEARLRESEERLTNIIQNAAEGIYTMSLDGVITFVSPVWTQLLGHDASEVEGQSFVPFIHPDDLAICQAAIKTVLATGEPQHRTYRIRHKNGSWRWHHTAGSLVKDRQGRPAYFVGVVEDVTERISAEQKLLDYANSLKIANRTIQEAQKTADAANRAKSEFLANMSHEIRTPMTAILGYVDVLLDGAKEKDTIESAQIIKRNGIYLLDLISDILDLSKIEAGKCTIDVQSCSPSHIATEVISLMKVRADAKGLPLTLEVEGDIPEIITTDPIRLRQILINLIGNAIKFTEVGSVRVVMRLALTSMHVGKLRFNVIDTGIGMTEEQMGLLFQPFSQVDSSARRRFGGTGLGLAVSKRLAEMLDGDIAVRSRPGQGTTFSLNISTGNLDESAMTQVPSNALATREPLANTPQMLTCRILLAEDGPDNQRLIAFLLRKAGAEVELAENGQTAFDLALAALQAGNPFDVILMDMQMPVMDGYQATQKLRSADYREPIIALTAHAMSGDRQKCIDAGCNDYISKPIDPKKLVGLVGAWVTREADARGNQSDFHRQNRFSCYPVTRLRCTGDS